MNAAEALLIAVRDVGCGADVARLERLLRRAPGVVRTFANAATEIAYIDHDPATTDPRRLARVIEEAGYRTGRAVGV